MKEEKPDTLRGYCRRLGHEVDFAYCRVAAEGSPCFKILDCWFERFDIQAYMKARYAPDEMASILAEPRSKVATLYDLIEKAKRAHSRAE
jgi:hypothetical protein